MKKYALCFSFLFVLFFAVASCASAADVLVIVNKGVVASSISKDDLKRVYLGKKTRWDNGDKINFCLIKTGLLKTFVSDYVGSSVSHYFKYWKKQVFTGKGHMPPFYGKDDDVVKFVAGTKGAIGFVPAGSNTDSVKVITVN